MSQRERAMARETARDMQIWIRCCCNCRRCLRIWDDKGNFRCECEIDRHYIGYVGLFEGWCRRWAKVQWQEGESDVADK